MITLRNLQTHELHRLAEIDRNEHITLIYRVEDGALISEPIDSQATPWSPDRIDGFVRDLTTCLQSGGTCIGAEDSAAGNSLAGVAALSAQPIETHPTLT